MKTLILALSLIAFNNVTAQRIAKITMTETGKAETIAVELDENVVVNLTDDGTVGTWGIEIYKGRTDRMQERLEPYTGKVDYYTEFDNAAFRGKVKYIGQKQFTYYADYEDTLLRGKLKSIGTAQVEYYGRYDEEALRGKIKRIGTNNIEYYSSFDIAFAGKLKALGPVQITYYTNMDDVAFRGKVKTVGQSQFIYYSSYERKELRGQLKNGWRMQYVNGIKFLIR